MCKFGSKIWPNLRDGIDFRKQTDYICNEVFNNGMKLIFQGQGLRFSKPKSNKKKEDTNKSKMVKTKEDKN